MTWEETIQFIRTKPEYDNLVKDAYYDDELSQNVVRFGKSEEFSETLKLANIYAPSAKTVLDIGAGNGISSVNFALKGYHVAAVEPDPSDSIGANAIRRLKTSYNLENLSVYESYAEELGFPAESFDIVYVRQAMHHAYDLKKFIAECARVLKPGGILMTVRDHVVFSPADKEWFLSVHPLHAFYGGENAFAPAAYKQAMTEAGLNISEEIKHYDSVINYSPINTGGLNVYAQNIKDDLKRALQKKAGIFANFPGVFYLYRVKNGFAGSYLNERKVAGRMYSYIATKPCKKS